MGGMTLYLQLKSKSIAQFKFNSLLILGICTLAFFISQHTLNKAKLFNQSTVYGSFADRLGTVVDTDNETTNIRLKYWEGALDLISKQPLTGVGYGNWKLYSPLYTGPLINDNLFSKHPHNDFIEIAGESGILNSIIFLSIFICAFFSALSVLRSKRDPELKLISIIILGSLVGYFIDAFFNFPSERPHIQVLFAFILGSILTKYFASAEAPSKSHRPISKLILIVPVLLIGITTIYVHAVVFQSMKAQWVVDNDLNSIDNIPGALPKLKFAQVNAMLPDYPQIAENSEIIAFKKAKYLRAEKRYQEALHLLDSVQYQSPYLPYSDYLRCNIYLETKQLDSAYKYGERAAAIKPRNFYYFRMASYLARVNNDIDGVHKLFKTYRTYRNDQQSWSYYALTMFYSKANRAEVKKVVDSGLKYYPQDTTMLSYKPFLPK
jgi:tetratricopeptide (TPR) repeat protein